MSPDGKIFLKGQRSIQNGTCWISELVLPNISPVEGIKPSHHVSLCYNRVCAWILCREPETMRGALDARAWLLSLYMEGKRREVQNSTSVRLTCKGEKRVATIHVAKQLLHFGPTSQSSPIFYNPKMKQTCACVPVFFLASLSAYYN